ncbi:MAG: HXXEE domain-containing protein [Acidobacteriota bacterium]
MAELLEVEVMSEGVTQTNADDMRSASRRQPPADAGSWTLWLVVAAIGVHIIEEHALNFNGWAARQLHAPITPEDFHVTNAGVILYSIACAVIGWRAPAIALSGAALVFVNALGFHLLSSLLVGAYSPGTATAMALFVPAAVVAYRAAARDGVLTARVAWLSLGIAVMWHAFMGAVYAFKYFAPLYP